MNTLNQLIKVLDLRAGIRVWSDKLNMVFDGKVYELLNSEEGFLSLEIKEWRVNNLSETLEVLLESDVDN